MKLLKILFTTVGILLLLIIIAAIAAPFIINPNNYKPQIAEQVKKATGRDLSLGGDINLSFFPWLGAKIEDVSLSNPPSFGQSSFAKLDDIQVKVKILPLLKKEIEIGTIILDGLDVNLIKNAQGKTNWEDLSQPKKEEQSSKAPTEDEDQSKDKKSSMAIAGITIGGISIKDAHISYRDDQEKKSYDINHFNITSDTLEMGKPANIALNTDFNANDPSMSGHLDFGGTVNADLDNQYYQVQNTNVKLTASGSDLPVQQIALQLGANIDAFLAKEQITINSLKLTGDVQGDQAVRFSLDSPKAALLKNRLLKIDDLKLVGKTKQPQEVLFALKSSIIGDLETKRYGIKNLILRAQAKNEQSSKPINVGVGTGGISVDLNKETLALQNLLVDAFGVKLKGQVTGTQILGDKAIFSGNLASNQFNPKQIADSLGITLSPTADKTALTTAQLGLGFIASKTSLNANKVVVKLDSSTLQGVTSVKDFNQPAIHYDFTLDKIDTDRYFPPKTTTTKEKSLVGVLRTLKIKGDINAGAVPLTIGKTTPVKLGSAFSAVEPKLNGRLDFSGSITPTQQNGYQIQNTYLKLTSNSAKLPIKMLDLQLGANITANTDKKYYQLKNTDLKLTTSGSALPVDQVTLQLGANIEAFLAQEQYTINNLKLTSQVKGDKEANISLDSPTISLVKNQLKADTLKLASQVKKPQNTQINLTTALEGDLDKKQYHFKGLKLDTKAQDAKFPNPVNAGLSTGIDIDLNKETLAVQNLNLVALGINLAGQINGTQILSAPHITGQISSNQFNLRQVAQTLAIDLPSTADKSALTSAQVNLGFLASPTSLDAQQLTFKLDESTLQGSASIYDFVSPRIQSDLSLDKINVDRYLPPVNKQLGGSPSKTASVSTSSASSELPVDTLRALNINSSFKIGELIFKGLRTQNVQVDLVGKDGLVSIDPMAADLYQGSFNGNVHLDVRGSVPQLATQEKLTNVQVGPLLKDYSGSTAIRGTTHFASNFTAAGVSSDAMKQHLNGSAEFSFTDGAIRGVNIVKMIQSGIGAIAGLASGDSLSQSLQSLAAAPTDNGEETKFSSLKGTLSAVDGVLKNSDLDIRSPALKATGLGTANLANEKVDYLLKVNLPSLKDTTVPVKVSGTLSQLKYDVDMGTVMQGRAGQAIKGKIGNLLGIQKGEDSGASDGSAKNLGKNLLGDILGQPNGNQGTATPADAGNNSNGKQGLGQSILEGILGQPDNNENSNPSDSGGNSNSGKALDNAIQKGIKGLFK
ncbi:AsmA family protein [Candidatus Nitrosacidococcus tergens]|uniref:AsmA domain-containing protein n=1 Tax=Candidatus Nitrosacidococcus tergens TaxID=553981 RepID=A0A7G1Q8N5_9GAMM|nr:AsmA family protein [Candidatus Nitrosacidococcus tergens]CAB1275155.1 protein of unknown function [Candidatus Nitrosacidococcus tergens]